MDASISMSILWSVIIVLSLIVEMFTVQLTGIWFAIGAFIAAIMSLFQCPVYLQVIAFFVVSIILLFVSFKFLFKDTNSNVEQLNADAIIGKFGKAISDVDNTKGVGEIMVKGKVWSAVSIDETVIPKDSKILIKDIKGVKAVVQKINE